MPGIGRLPRCAGGSVVRLRRVWHVRSGCSPRSVRRLVCGAVRNRIPVGVRAGMGVALMRGIRRIVGTVRPCVVSVLLLIVSMGVVVVWGWPGDGFCGACVAASVAGYAGVYAG